VLVTLFLRLGSVKLTEKLREHFKQTNRNADPDSAFLEAQVSKRRRLFLRDQVAVFRIAL
jgi:hypothetical protein